jgi:hypothetical protein
MRCAWASPLVEVLASGGGDGEAWRTDRGGFFSISRSRFLLPVRSMYDFGGLAARAIEAFFERVRGARQLDRGE